MGDFVDRGFYSVETFLLLLALKVQCPSSPARWSHNEFLQYVRIRFANPLVALRTSCWQNLERESIQEALLALQEPENFSRDWCFS